MRYPGSHLPGGVGKGDAAVPSAAAAAIFRHVAIIQIFYGKWLSQISAPGLGMPLIFS